MVGTIKKLSREIVDQEAHVARMIEQNPASPSIRAGKRILFVFRATLAHLEAGNSAESFDLNAASAAARKAVA